MVITPHTLINTFDICHDVVRDLHCDMDEITRVEAESIEQNIEEGKLLFD